MFVFQLKPRSFRTKRTNSQTFQAELLTGFGIPGCIYLEIRMKNFNQSHFCNGIFQKPRHPFYKHFPRLSFMCCNIPRNLIIKKVSFIFQYKPTFIVNTSPVLKACCISASSPCPSLPHNNWAFLFSSTKFNRSDLTKMCCFSFWCNSVDCDVPTLPFF